MAAEIYLFIQYIFLITFTLLLPATFIYLYIAYKRFKGSEFKKLLGYITITFSAMSVGFILNSLLLITNKGIDSSAVQFSFYVIAMTFGFISALEAYKLGKIYGFSENFKFKI